MDRRDAPPQPVPTERVAPARRRPFGRGAIAAGAVAALALVTAGACSRAPQVTVQGSGGGTSSGTPNGVSVTGLGEASGAPDTLTVSLGASVRRSNVDAAVADDAKATQAAIDALRMSGVAEKDLQTASYSISPDYGLNGSRVPIAWNVSNQITAKVHDLANAGKIIDAATHAAGDAVVVQGVSFSLENDTDQRATARAKAMDDAKAKATQLAKLAGRSLGPAEAVTESTASTPVYARASSAEDAAASTPTPVQAGQVASTITVEVRYSLR